VLHALINAGDKILGLELAHGGHLTHGMKINFSGKLYQVGAYGVDPDTFLVDMDVVRAKALEQRPDVIIGGWSAYPRHLDFAAFRSIADEVGAKLWVDMAHFAGLVAAGLHPSPVPHSDVVSSTVHKTIGGPRSGFILSKEEYAKKIDSAVFPGQQGGPLMHVIAAKAVAFKEALSPEFKQYQQQVVKNAAVLADTLTARGLRIVSGGTQSHVMLVDLRPKNLTGKEAEAILGQAHMTCNKNGIPNDPQKPMITSGIRLGSPAFTTRGFKEEQARATANLIADVLDKPHDAANIAAVRAKVAALTRDFPVYR
jgi:glycine hydroxymethyltransferase